MMKEQQLLEGKKKTKTAVEAAEVIVVVVVEGEEEDQALRFASQLVEEMIAIKKDHFCRLSLNLRILFQER